MKVTKIVGNQRVVADVDVRTPASFARALTTKNVVDMTVSTINTTSEQALLVKTIQTRVRPFAIAIVEEKK